MSEDGIFVSFKFHFIELMKRGALPASTLKTNGAWMGIAYEMGAFFTETIGISSK